MRRREWTVLVALALAVVAGGAAAPAYAGGGLPGRTVAQAPPGGSSVVAEEAPSSISTSDQVRAFVVLGVCVVAIGLPVLLVVLRSRRRQREALPPNPAGP